MFAFIMKFIFKFHFLKMPANNSKNIYEYGNVTVNAEMHINLIINTFTFIIK